MTAVSTVAPRKIFYKGESTKNFDIVRRLGKLEVGFWLEISGDFFCAPRKFPNICVSIFHTVFAIKIHDQNPQSKSTKNFKNFGFLSKQNFAQKKKEMSWSKWEF